MNHQTADDEVQSPPLVLRLLPSSLPGSEAVYVYIYGLALLKYMRVQRHLWPSRSFPENSLLSGHICEASLFLPAGPSCNVRSLISYVLGLHMDNRLINYTLQGRERQQEHTSKCIIEV